MPRAALLSIHARVDGTQPTAWEDPSLVQVWGPRFSAYVVPADDLALFTLARLPDKGRTRSFGVELANRLDEFVPAHASPDVDMSGCTARLLTAVSAALDGS